MNQTKQTAAQRIAADPSVEYNRMVDEKITRALELDEQKKAIDGELKELKQFFADMLRTPEATSKKLATTAGIVIWTRSNTYSIDAAHVPALKSALGKAFKDYVTEKVEYKPNAAFREMLADGDRENVELFREATEIKSSENVKFEPVLKRKK
jgi:hypothetical protein